MSSELFEFVSESVLFDRGQIERQYRNLSEDELERELVAYRTLQLANSPAVEKRVRDNPSALKFFTGSTDPVFDLLKQSAWYLDQIVIADPVFPSTHQWSEHAKTMNELIGLKNDGALNRLKLARSAQYLIYLRPMIQDGFIVMLPITALFEPPK